MYDLKKKYFFFSSPELVLNWLIEIDPWLNDLGHDDPPVENHYAL